MSLPIKTFLFALFLLFSPLVAVNSGNPFLSGNYYVNPTYQTNLQNSISTSSGQVKDTLTKMLTVPSAYWIDVKSKLTGSTTSSVEGILKDAVAKGSKLVVFIVYDLPNRDCHAKASNGEICCTYNADRTCNYDASGDCSAGIAEYQTQYIDPLYSVLSQYADKVPIVLIIEPDSLPNLATNLGDPHCGNTATQNAYTQGISYAINKLKTLKVTMYLDAAHGGWLGWADNLKKFTQIVAKLTISVNDLRGFSTNVANYQPLGQRCTWSSADGYRNDYCLNGQHATDPCCADPCKLLTQWNAGNNEMNYADLLSHAFLKDLNYQAHFLVDTGRNGVGNMRSDSANWCNIRNAGVGLIPTTNTGYPDQIDAFFWLKTPGESDGCTQILPDGTSCPRFDSMCSSTDSIGSQSGEPRAPQAGAWFDYQIKQLAANANLGNSSNLIFD